MRSVVRNKLDMAARVRSFCRTHPLAEPGYEAVVGRLEERLTRAEVIAARQHEGAMLAISARKRREEIRKVVHFQLLRYLVSAGGLASRTQSELAERFRLPGVRASNRTFLTSVRAMLILARAQQDALVKEGMAPALLDQLEQLLTEFEAAIEAARQARLERIGARGDLDEVSAELMESVVMLDGINRWRFGKQPDLLVEWNSARHLPSRSQVGNGNGNGNGTIPPEGGAAPAP